MFIHANMREAFIYLLSRQKITRKSNLVKSEGIFEKMVPGFRVIYEF